jgi:hypothetical protein
MLAAAGISCPPSTAAWIRSDWVMAGIVEAEAVRDFGLSAKAGPAFLETCPRHSRRAAKPLGRNPAAPVGVRRNGGARRAEPPGELPQLVGAAGGRRIDALGVLDRREIVGPRTFRRRPARADGSASKTKSSNLTPFALAGFTSAPFRRPRSRSSCRPCGRAAAGPLRHPPDEFPVDHVDRDASRPRSAGARSPGPFSRWSSAADPSTRSRQDCPPRAEMPELLLGIGLRDGLARHLGAPAEDASR